MKKHSCRTFWPAPILFPVSDSPDADPENLGKAFLGELEFFACGSYIHSRDFDDMPFAARFVTLGKGECIRKPRHNAIKRVFGQGHSP